MRISADPNCSSFGEIWRYDITLDGRPIVRRTDQTANMTVIDASEERGTITCLVFGADGKYQRERDGAFRRLVFEGRVQIQKAPVP